MTSKDEILKSVRACATTAVPLPSLEHTWIQYPDRAAQFQSLLETVGGRCLRVDTVEQIPPLLAENPQFAGAARVTSLVPGIDGNFDANQVEDPHELEAVDWAILPAEFGVAENGAVWVTDATVRHRALYFIVQHLALVLPADQLVHNMHEAYARLTVGSSSAGVFMSGPSKTADIEQSLVIGAHGPRSLTMFLVGSPSDGSA